MLGATLDLMPTEPVVYRPDQRPDIEVLVDDAWHRGELRAWSKRSDDWWAAVSYRTAPGMQYYDTIPAARVRPDERTGR